MKKDYEYDNWVAYMEDLTEDGYPFWFYIKIIGGVMLHTVFLDNVVANLLDKADVEHIFSCPIWHKEWGGYSFSAIQKLIFNGHVLQIVKIPELNGGRDASEWFCSAIARKINRDIESELLNI